MFDGLERIMIHSFALSMCQNCSVFCFQSFEPLWDCCSDCSAGKEVAQLSFGESMTLQIRAELPLFLQSTLLFKCSAGALATLLVVMASRSSSHRGTVFICSGLGT